MGYSLKIALENMLHRKNIPLVMYTDSHSLYGLCVSLTQTTEKRLLVDLNMIRKAYEKRDISRIVWISGQQNPADDLTKTGRRNGSLSKLVTTAVFTPTD